MHYVERIRYKIERRDIEGKTKLAGGRQKQLEFFWIEAEIWIWNWERIEKMSYQLGIHLWTLSVKFLRKSNVNSKKLYKYFLFLWLFMPGQSIFKFLVLLILILRKPQSYRGCRISYFKDLPSQILVGASLWCMRNIWKFWSMSAWYVSIFSVWTIIVCFYGACDINIVCKIFSQNIL